MAAIWGVSMVLIVVVMIITGIAYNQPLPKKKEEKPSEEFIIMKKK